MDFTIVMSLYIVLLYSEKRSINDENLFSGPQREFTKLPYYFYYFLNIFLFEKTLLQIVHEI